MREIIDNDETTDETSQESMTPDENSELILGADTPEQRVDDLWPEASHVFRLWQVYLERVNPLTKIIHVPTLQPYLAEAIGRSNNVPKSVEALLFSIFLMATISLRPEECQALLGQSREEALQKYSKGARLTLLRMNFLKSHDLTTLQALVIYLVGRVLLARRFTLTTILDILAGPVQPTRRLDPQRHCHTHGPKDGPSPRR